MPKFRSRLGTFRKTLQQTDASKNVGAKTKRSTRVFQRDPNTDLLKVTQRLAAKNDFRHVSVGVQIRWRRRNCA